ncbi:MAG: hypothetical protein K2Y37_13335 [Pirellulales bacterium]|nr:hypothetical protein [Pirellulales bacterium]
MFERISSGWQLTKQSFNVLRMDKELLLFPALSGLACLLVLASFAVPLWATGFAEEVARDENRQANVLGWIVLFAFYLANYFVIVFFNSALVACAVLRFNGENPTLRDGLSAAMARLPQILGWALVAASVGVILRAIESRSEKVGAFVAGLLGMGWSIVTFFVVPVIVIERAGPVQAVKRSTAILKKTWGESLTANFSVSSFTFLFSIPAIFLLVAGIVVAGIENPVVGGVMIGAGLLWILAVSLVSSAMTAIVLAALYMYAATDRVPEAFDQSLLVGAFGKK